MEGVLVSGYGGFYHVVNEAGEAFTLRCRKKFRHQRMTPLVGDRVLFTEGHGEEEGWIEEILPRTSEIIRPPVANVTLLMAVVAPVPEPDLLLLDRMLVRARSQGMKTAVIVTKGDMDSTLPAQIRDEYANADTPVFPVCAETGDGLGPLRQAMAGEVCCLSGQSGVGKSTLLNRLLGISLETGSISQRIQRGKNTTRKAELLLSGGLRVLDTAGFSLLELDGEMDPAALKECWPDFEPYEGCCRFEPCFHDREPGCAVTAAVQAGKLNEARVARYRQLLAECRENWRKRYD